MAQLRARREVLLWSLSLYAAWIATWSLYTALNRDGYTAARESATWWWLAAKVIVWCTPVVCLVARKRQSILTFLGLNHVRGLGRGVAGTLLFGLAIVLIDASVPGRWPTPARIGSSSLTVLGVLLLLNPMLEEVLFRGYALRKLVEAGSSFWRANLEAALLFTLLHLPGWLFQGRHALECAVMGLQVAALGFVFGAVRGREGTLWSSVLIHVVNNAWHEGWFLLA